MTDQEITALLHEALNCTVDTMQALQGAVSKLMGVSNIMSTHASTPKMMLHGGALWAASEAVKKIVLGAELVEETMKCLINPIDKSYYPLVIYQPTDRSSTLQILCPPGTTDPENPGDKWTHYAIVWLPPATAQGYADTNLEGDLPQ